MVSHETASSSAECSRDKPPFSFVRGQDSTMWNTVWVSPQGHRSVSVSRHFLLQAPPLEQFKRFQAFSFLCTFVPGSEKTIEKTFAPVELSFHGTFAPWNFRSCGTSSGVKVPRTFVPTKLSYHENEYFKNFRSKCPKTRPINLTITYAH